MKKPRLGTNDWGTDDRGDEQGFFDSWVTCDERNAHHGGDLLLFGLSSELAFCLTVGTLDWTPRLDRSPGPLCRLLSEPPLALLLDPIPNGGVGL